MAALLPSAPSADCEALAAESGPPSVIVTVGVVVDCDPPPLPPLEEQAPSVAVHSQQAGHEREKGKDLTDGHPSIKTRVLELDQRGFSVVAATLADVTCHSRRTLPGANRLHVRGVGLSAVHLYEIWILRVGKSTYFTAARRHAGLWARAICAVSAERAVESVVKACMVVKWALVIGAGDAVRPSPFQCSSGEIEGRFTEGD